MKNNTPSRKKAFLTQVTGGYILTTIAMIKGLFLLPIYFKFISYELYGYWVTIGSIVALLSILNFGISTMTMQRISKSYAEKDFEKVGNYFINSLLISFLIAIVFLGVGFLLSYLLQDLLTIADDKLQIVRISFFLALFTVMFSFFSDAFRGLAVALLKPLFGLQVMVGANLVGIGLVLLLFYNNFGLLALPISLLATEFIIVLFCGIYVLFLYKQFDIKSKINITILKEYFTFSPHLFKLVLGNKILENSHPILITSFLGTEITTAYDVTRKMIDIVLTILNHLNSALLAPFSHLVGEKDTTLIKETTIKIIMLSFLIGFIGYGTYIVTNGLFVSLWVGKDMVLSQNIIILLGLSAFMFSMNRLFRSLLFGFDELKFATNSVLAEALAYVIISLIFIDLFGIITIPFVFLIVSGFFALKLLNKVTTISNVMFSCKQIIRYTVMAIVILGIIIILQSILNDISWKTFILKVIITILGIVMIEVLFSYRYFIKIGAIPWK